MRRNRRGFLWGLTGLACAAAAATAQPRRTEMGRALDASLRVGSGGYNTPVPAGSEIGSQLYVTGQVRGLGAFRGRVGYFADNELRLELPSARLGDFRRHSVGLEDVLRGPTYLPQPYYERTTTTLKIDRVLAGDALPGSNVPATAAARSTPLGRQLYIDAMTRPQTVAPLAAGVRLGLDVPGAGGSVAFGGPLAVQPIAPALRAAPAPLVARTVPGLFAVARRADRAELARELYLQARGQGMRDGRIDAHVPGRSEGAPDANTPGVSPTAGADATRGGPLGTPAADQDVFLDMLVRLRDRRERARQLPDGATPRATLLPAVATQPVRPAPGPAATIGKGGLVELSPADSLVLHGLAGRSKDLFNIHMNRAAKQLRARKFYDAANLYETAGIVDPRNPLARVGMGLSLLGAGESLSAAYQLQRAISLFPPMMETQIDLSAMIDRKVVDAELASIERRLRDADRDSRQMLQFLAAFLYENSSRHEKAKTHAEKLITTVHRKSALRAYAEFLLKRGETPAKEPPAKGTEEPKP